MKRITKDQYMVELEATIKADGITIVRQTEVIQTLMTQRDEARRNLKIGTTQWDQWRKQTYEQD